MTKGVALLQFYIKIAITRKKKGYHSLLVVLKHNHMLYKPKKTIVSGAELHQNVCSAQWHGVATLDIPTPHLHTVLRATL